MIRFAGAPIEGHDDRFDLLVPVGWLNLECFAAEIPLDEQSIVIGDLLDSPGKVEIEATTVIPARGNQGSPR